MEPFERTTCTFIVKIWADVEDAPYPRTWRGRVRHIPSGTQYYFDDLARFVEIFVSHLDEMGVTAHQHISRGSEDAIDCLGKQQCE